MPTAARPASPAQPSPQPSTAPSPPAAWWQHVQTNQPVPLPPEHTPTRRRLARLAYGLQVTALVLLTAIIMIIVLAAIAAA
jgi:hypothetical protein